MVLCLCFLWNLTFFPRKTPLVAQMVKRLAYNAGDLGLIPGLGKSPGEGNDNPLTPVFLPGEFHGQRSLMGYSP